MLRHRSRNLQWGRETSGERDVEFGERDENFLGAFDESGEGEHDEVGWTRMTRKRTRGGKFDG